MYFSVAQIVDLLVKSNPLHLIQTSAKCALGNAFLHPPGGTPFFFSILLRSLFRTRPHTSMAHPSPPSPVSDRLPLPGRRWVQQWHRGIGCRQGVLMFYGWNDIVTFRSSAICQLMRCASVLTKSVRKPLKRPEEPSRCGEHISPHAHMLRVEHETGATSMSSQSGLAQTANWCRIPCGASACKCSGKTKTFRRGFHPDCILSTALS